MADMPFIMGVQSSTCFKPCIWFSSQSAAQEINKPRQNILFAKATGTSKVAVVFGFYDPLKAYSHF